MRTLGWAAGVCAALGWATLAAAMAPTPAPAPAPAAPVAPPANPPPLSIFAPAPDGALAHLQSGLVCPASLAGYQRDAAQAFDAFGLDVGCDYARSDAVITLYLTRRADPSLLGVMFEAKREFLQLRADQHPVLTSESQAAMGGRAWDAALYTDDGGLRDTIWVSDLDGWTFEYRVTYRATVESRVAGDLAALTTQVLSTAGGRLDLCAKAQPPPRTGQPVTDASAINAAAMMSAIVGDGEAGATAQGKAVAPKPITWCVDRSVAQGNLPMLLWRGVDDDGADANIDMLSLMTAGAPPQLTVDADPLANLVQKNAGKPSFWVAKTHADGRTEIDGFFTARPTPEALAALAADVFAGKAQPLAAYSDDGKTVTIATPPK